MGRGGIAEVHKLLGKQLTHPVADPGLCFVDKTATAEYGFSDSLYHVQDGFELDPKSLERVSRCKNWVVTMPQLHLLNSISLIPRKHVHGVFPRLALVLLSELSSTTNTWAFR